jgi:hypothetical protein
MIGLTSLFARACLFPMEQLDAGVIPFPNQASFVILASMIPFQIMGISAAAILLMANLGKSNTPSAKILLSLSIADLLFCCSGFLLSILGITSGGFSTGLRGCYVSYGLLILLPFVSIETLTITALERYVSVVMGKVFTDVQIRCLIFGIWSTSSLIVFAPFLFQSPQAALQLESSGWSCSVKWYGRNWESVLVSSITMVIFSFSFVAITASYALIYQHFTETFHDKHLTKKASSQKRVWYQCTVLSGSFVALWSTYYLKMFFELISGRPVHSIFTAMGQGLGLICSLTNSLIIMYFDNRIRGNVMEFLRIKRPVDKCKNSIPSQWENPSDAS